MKLLDLQTGEKGIIVKISGRGAFRRRITEMGFIKGKEIQVIQNAPLKDPIQYRIMGYDLSLRRKDAALIEVVASKKMETDSPVLSHVGNHPSMMPNDELKSIVLQKSKTIRVAFIGNPNAGKTSLFNFASGSHEHVGNYSGVTVDAKSAEFKQNGYTFIVIDLPGTYSLSSYSAEEMYVRQHLNTEYPDVVINVVDATNLERNLYLTCQLIDMDARMVIALNMIDGLEKQGDQFDYESLAKMIGIPIVPTNGRTNKGLYELFDQVAQVYEETSPIVRHIHINYGETLENRIHHIKQLLTESGQIEESHSRRYLAIKLLEGEKETETYVSQLSNGNIILKERDKFAGQIEELLKTDCEIAFADARYGFISGALHETYKPNTVKKVSLTQHIDSIVTNKILGFPIFLLFMWLMFETTFRLGQYPMQWIETLVEWVKSFVQTYLQEGPLKDLLVDGIINGIGGVIVFLPNILILYTFISLMEDSGYMARTAFIMDKLMHKMGLHGKSFISLIMGFGCNVPAILATRTIESRNSRILTMLINPLMSCSARLPVYLVLAGAFFPERAGLIFFILYCSGIFLAVVMARIFKRVLFKEEDIPFVMELPPYRKPTWRSICIHMWDKASQYLRKMGGIILVASIFIWFLGYFPLQKEQNKQFEDQITATEQSHLSNSEKTVQIAEIRQLKNQKHQQHSYIGQMGQTIEPVLHPLGFDWRISVSLISGMAAKEVVVSTLSVLFTGEEENSLVLKDKLKQSKNEQGNLVFTPLVALSLMFFVLIYFPCIASVTAIIKESKSWKWGAFVIVYTCLLAWIVSFTIYQVGSLIT